MGSIAKSIIQVDARTELTPGERTGLHRRYIELLTSCVYKPTFVPGTTTGGCFTSLKKIGILNHKPEKPLLGMVCFCYTIIIYLYIYIYM